jgi:hypothetical protein
MNIQEGKRLTSPLRVKPKRGFSVTSGAIGKTADTLAINRRISPKFEKKGIEFTSDKKTVAKYHEALQNSNFYQSKTKPTFKPVISDFEMPDPDVYKRLKEAGGYEETPKKASPPRTTSLIKNQRTIL